MSTFELKKTAKDIGHPCYLDTWNYGTNEATIVRFPLDLGILHRQ